MIRLELKQKGERTESWGEEERRRRGGNGKCCELWEKTLVVCEGKGLATASAGLLFHQDTRRTFPIGSFLSQRLTKKFTTIGEIGERDKETCEGHLEELLR